MKGIILDLRNDPGGLLNSAVAVTASFIDRDKLVVYTDGRAEDSKMRLNARPEDYLRGRNRELRARVNELQTALESTLNTLQERRPNLPALRQTGPVTPFRNPR